MSFPPVPPPPIGDDYLDLSTQLTVAERHLEIEGRSMIALAAALLALIAVAVLFHNGARDELVVELAPPEVAHAP